MFLVYIFHIFLCYYISFLLLSSLTLNYFQLAFLQFFLYFFIGLLKGLLFTFQCTLFPRLRTFFILPHLITRRNIYWQIMIDNYLQMVLLYLYIEPMFYLSDLFITIWSYPGIKNAPPIGETFWWRRVDSNHRSESQQIYSLPPLATRELLRMKLNDGAGGRTRTPDLLITNQLLYQLSYTSRRRQVLQPTQDNITQSKSKVNSLFEVFSSAAQNGKIRMAKYSTKGGKSLFLH